MDDTSNSPVPPQDQVPTELASSPSTEKSANTETSHSTRSKKKLFGSILALFLIAGTIGIGSYLVKSRQTTSTQASLDSVSQCSEQGGAIRIGECNPGETPIGTVSGGDGQQLCCKVPDKLITPPDTIIDTPIPSKSIPSITVPSDTPTIPVGSSPVPTIPTDTSIQCPDPKQNLSVKVECISCAD